MLVANGLSTFPIKGNPVFSNGPTSLSKNLPYCPILCNWVFDNFILAEGLFAKALRSFENCVLVNSNLCGKLFSSIDSPTTFNEIFKVTSVSFFIPDFNLLNCELDNLRLTCYIESFYIGIILKQNKVTILSQFFVKNLKWFLSLLQ